MICAWVAGGDGIRAVSPEEALADALAGRGCAWVDLHQQEPEVTLRILEPLKIHPLVLEAMTSHLHRPKVDNYGSYLYLVLHTALWDEGRPRVQEMDILVGERWIVTVHETDEDALAAPREVIARRADLLARGPAPLLHYVLDTLADQYLSTIERISEEIDRLEEEVFEQPRTETHMRALRVKRGMSALRRIVGPQRDTVLALTRDEFRPIPPELRPYLRDVFDRLARIGDLLESYRDETASLLELKTSLAANRLNEVIKRLTVIATIGLPLTLWTGIYGMNFRFAEYEWKHPWLFVLALLLSTSIATWWYLKRKDWL